MFMRYTHFGVGHPTMLRRIIRDCFGYKSGLDDIIDDAGNSNEADVSNEDGEVYEGCGDDDDLDDDDVSDEEFSDEELEHEDEGNENDDGWEGDEPEDQDQDEHLSF